MGFEGLADPKDKRWENLPSPPSKLYHYRFANEKYIPFFAPVGDLTTKLLLAKQALY